PPLAHGRARALRASPRAPPGDPRPRSDRRRGTLRHARDARRAPDRPGGRAGRVAGRRRSPRPGRGELSAARGGAALGARPRPAGPQHGDADRDRGPQPPPPHARPAQRARLRRAHRRRDRQPPAPARRRVRVSGNAGGGWRTTTASGSRARERSSSARREPRGRWIGGIGAAQRAQRARGVALEVLYLEASEDVLVRRFSETRRPHPAALGGVLADGIRREREKLRPLREVAGRVLDTSALTVHELRSALRDLVERPEAGTMTVALVSFGYKYGLPTDADLALDCRFLPNPFFVEELRARTGADPAVADWVLRREESQEFLGRVLDLLAFTLPLYQREGKSYLTIALGCTGGRHR